MSIILLLNSTKLIKGIFLNVAHWMLYINIYIYLCVCALCCRKFVRSKKNKYVIHVECNSFVISIVNDRIASLRAVVHRPSNVCCERPCERLRN